MATVPTLEQWLLEKLRDRFGIEDIVVPSKDNFSVRLVDSQDSNRFTATSSFLVEATRLSKTEADNIQASVKGFLRTLPMENFILNVTVTSESAVRVDSPAVWNYGVVIQIRHRVRDSWETS